MICALALLVFLAQAVAEPFTSFNQYEIEISALKESGSGRLSIPLRNNTTTSFKSFITKGMKVVFEDKQPGANWGHPALLKLISPFGDVIEELTITFPPLGKIVSKLAPLFQLPYKPIKFELNDFDGKYKVAEPSNFYAILLNGDAEERHWNDFSFLYRGLTKVYGYSKNNIFVLDSNHVKNRNDLDGDGEADILYESNFQSLKKVIETLSEKMKKNDRLFIVVNDHGEIINGETIFYLADKQIRPSDFSKLLKMLPTGKKTVVFGQCYGGAFVRPILSVPAIGISASTNEEVSWATSDFRFDEFIYQFSVGLFQQTFEGKWANSDFNADGRISFAEAYSYAVSHDRKKESPLAESPKNSGLASQTGLSF